MPEAQKESLTLIRFLDQRQQRHPEASGELTRVMAQLSTVAKIIANYVGRSALLGIRGKTGETNVQGEDVKELDRLSNQAFAEAFEYVDIVGAIVSEEMTEPLILPGKGGRDKYVVLVDPLDGSSNLEVDCMTGSIFSIRACGGDIRQAILQDGSRQVGAGYILYGSATHLVYTFGDGVHSFVLDEEIGEFVLDHAGLHMPAAGTILSGNFGNREGWDGATRAFVDRLLQAGEHSYSLRYSGALVADLHQILHRGGIYFYPEDRQHPSGKLRLLYECAPLAMVVEQAGGSATTGRGRVMEVTPREIHQRIPFAIGSRREIALYEQCHNDHPGGSEEVTT